MRVLTNASGLFVSLALIILIHCSIISTHIRDSEVSNGLESAVDYATDAMQDMCTATDFETTIDKTAAVNDIIAAFCASLEKVISTDGDITVTVIEADLGTGSFDFVVEENYRYAFHGRQGKTRCERAVNFFY